MYSPEARAEIVDHVVACLESGDHSLASALRVGEFMPSVAQFYRWMDDDQEIMRRVERAREIGAEQNIEQIREIADTVKEDKTAIAKAKLRIYARETFAAKIAPKRFGNKLDLTSGNEKLPAPAATDNRLQAIVQMVASRKQAALPQQPEEENDNAED